MEGSDCLANGINIPHEDAGVPVVVAGREVLLGSGDVGLLLEGLHLIYLVHVSGFGSGDVAVASLGTAGLDADGDDDFLVGCIAECLAEDTLILGGVDDKSIGGGYYDVGIGMLLLDLPAGVGYTGGSVACLGLGENIVNGHVRDLLLDNADVFLVGDHPHVLNWTDGLETVDSKLDEGTAHAHHVDELLGVVRGGHGPEAAANSASHNDYLYVVMHNYLLIRYFSIIVKLFSSSF